MNNRVAWPLRRTRTKTDDLRLESTLHFIMEDTTLDTHSAASNGMGAYQTYEANPVRGGEVTYRL